MSKRGRSEFLTLDQFCMNLQSMNDDGEHTDKIRDKFIEIAMDVHRKYPDIHLSLSNSTDQCFSFDANLRNRTSHLNYLLFVEDKVRQCTGGQLPNFGSWLLKLVDSVNICLGIEKCFLQNAATFVVDGHEYNADCVYSRDNHGVGFYMSRGWLVESNDPVHTSNKEIESWNDWWNHIEGKKTLRRENPQGVHQCRSGGLTDMVKFYNMPLQIYRPDNPLAPAIIYREGELKEDRIQRLESFDYRQGQINLKEYHRLLKEEEDDIDILFSILREVYPGPTDEVLKRQIMMDIDTSAKLRQAATKAKEDVRTFQITHLSFNPNSYPLTTQFQWFRAFDTAHRHECFKTYSVVVLTGPNHTLGKCEKSETVFTQVLDNQIRSPGRESMAVLAWSKKEQMDDMMQWSEYLGDYTYLSFLHSYYAALFPFLVKRKQIDTEDVFTNTFTKWDQEFINSMRFLCLTTPSSYLVNKPMEINAQCLMVLVDGERFRRTGIWEEFLQQLVILSPTKEVNFLYEWPFSYQAELYTIRIPPRMLRVTNAQRVRGGEMSSVVMKKITT